MTKITPIAKELFDNGFAVINRVFSDSEINAIIQTIKRVDVNGNNFRKSDDLFAIRQFVSEVPGIAPLIFNGRFKEIVNDVAGPGFFLTKAIYFDKPPLSNWFVAWHQDLTIPVDKKVELTGYGP